ncbi:MAG: hypothetical protein Q7J68_04410 [Thermoplasmata archaeon]|nr:hypothetical protein [Thermoplasmata archaeon]
MSRNPSTLKLAKSWQIEILQNEIDSLNDVLGRTSELFDPEEKDGLIETRNSIEQWADELKGVSKPKLSLEDIDERCHILDNEINMFSEILLHEETLNDSEASDLKDDIKKLKQWKTELRGKR